MVDDSDFSSDHDTVSLASTEQADDSPYDQIASILDDMQSLPVTAATATTDLQEDEHDPIDETPQQSTITVTPERQPVTIIPAVHEHKLPKPTAVSKWPSLTWLMCLGALTNVLVFSIWQWQYQTASQLVTRQHQIEDLTKAYQAVNVTRLLSGSPGELRYEATNSEILLAFPEGGKLPEPYAFELLRQSQHVPANMTKIMPGVLSFKINRADAYGEITIELLCKKPLTQVTFTHDFGQPLVHAVRTLAERILNKDMQIFFDQAASSAHRIEQTTKQLVSEIVEIPKLATAVTAAVKSELRRDLQLSKERASSIASNLKRKKSCSLRQKARGRKRCDGTMW